MTAPLLVNLTVDLDLSEFHADTYSGLSQGLRETIALSPEYGQATGVSKPDESLTGHLNDNPPMDDTIEF
jgi:hypothetical protein